MGVLLLLLAAGCGSGGGGTEVADSEATLFLAGDGELWAVNAETEDVEHLRLGQLAPGDPPYRIVARDDELALWGGVTYVLDPTLDERPRTLAADSLFFIPSDNPDRVWVAINEGGRAHL